MSTRILAHDQIVSNDTWQTGQNNNDIIIGPSGSGKTRSYVLPNILQATESMIIIDTKGDLCQQTGPILEQQGYVVQELDLSNCMGTAWGYNPLEYIRMNHGCCHEQDVMAIAAALVPIETIREPYWELAARSVLACIIGYVMEYLPEQEHNMDSVTKLFLEMGTGRFDSLMQELVEIDPDCLSAVQYKMFKSSQKADKMYASIQGVLAEKLSTLTFVGARVLLSDSYKNIDLRCIGERKTAVFLRISDTDRSMDRLASLFCTQALQVLCASADKCERRRLEVPVRLILDDFAAVNSCIPDFDKITSVIRSRDISVSVILQSLSQLESAYGHSKAMTIVNNCDHMLYLGGQDVETAQYIAVKARKSVAGILQMPLDRAWLFARGERPRRVQKYNLTDHPLYSRLPEAGQNGTNGPNLAQDWAEDELLPW